LDAPLGDVTLIDADRVYPHVLLWVMQAGLPKRIIAIKPDLKFSRTDEDESTVFFIAPGI
jgi:hypothetical protein